MSFLCFGSCIVGGAGGGALARAGAGVECVDAEGGSAVSKGVRKRAYLYYLHVNRDVLRDVLRDLT